MSRIAVFRPTEPAAQSLTVVLQLYVGFPVPFSRRTAEVLLNAFPDKRLVVVKYEAYKVQSPAVPVGTVIPDRKHLLVPFQVQLQVFHVFPYVCKKPVKFLFARCKEYHVVRIAEVVFHSLYLLYPMVEICEIQVCEIL